MSINEQDRKWLALSGVAVVQRVLGSNHFTFYGVNFCHQGVCSGTDWCQKRHFAVFCI